MFEAVEFVEHPNEQEPRETPLGEFEDEMLAVDAARVARSRFMESGSDHYAWWVVRKPGARLAQYIADSKTNKEFVLDLTSGQLIEV